MKAFFVVFIVTSAVVILVTFGRIGKTQADPGEIVPVRITMLGQIATVKGIDIAEDATRQWHYSASKMDPGIVEVILPDGKLVSVWAKSVFIDAYHGTVVFVEILPQQSSLLYKDAVEHIKRTLTLVKAGPDAHFEDSMAQWPDDIPGWDKNRGAFLSLRAGSDFKVNDPRKTFLEVDLRPSADGGWYSVIRLCVDTQTGDRLAGLGAAKNSATQPSTTTTSVQDVERSQQQH